MKNWDIKGVGNACVSEGMGYAIQHYLSHESIEDEKLAKLWKEAGDAISRVEGYLTEHLGDGWDEE